MTSFLPLRDPNDLTFSPIEIDLTLAFQSAVTRLGHEVWCDMADVQALPDRKHLDPRAFGSFLPHLNLFDLHLQGGELASLSPRVIGAEFEAVFGHIKGRALEDVLPQHVLTRWIGAATAVLDHGAPLRATGRVAYENKEHYSFELMLALMSDGDEMPSVLYVVVSFDLSAPPAASHV